MNGCIIPEARHGHVFTVSKGGSSMAMEEASASFKKRLGDLIKLALSGQSVQLDIKVHKNLVQQIGRSESSDDINIETDMCLFMAEFRPVQGKTKMVTKVYANCPINKSQIADETTRHIANKRLRMDDAHLEEAKANSKKHISISSWSPVGFRELSASKTRHQMRTKVLETINSKRMTR